MFDRFGDYMFSLLPAPLKRGKPKNQLRIYMSVIGELFDNLKQDLFRLRLETNIQTCSLALLYVFARERDMVRIGGESEENFRERVRMKWEVAQMAGSQEGIRLAMQLLGYPGCNIIPLYLTDPDRWAEINIVFPSDIDKEYTIDLEAVKNEVLKVKKASTLPHYLFRYQAGIQVPEDTSTRMICRFTLSVYSGIRYLDGTWRLDGTQRLDSGIRTLPAKLTYRFTIPSEEQINGKVITNHKVWCLDGSYTLDGSHTLDAYIREEQL